MLFVFPVDLNDWGHLLPIWRTSFSIPYKLSLLVTNSLSACLSGNVFISPSFLKKSFIRFTFIDWDFPLSLLYMLSHCLLAAIVSNEKSVVNLIGFPLSENSFFSHMTVSHISLRSSFVFIHSFSLVFRLTTLLLIYLQVCKFLLLCPLLNFFSCTFRI